MSNKPNQTRVKTYKLETIAYRSELAGILKGTGMTVREFTTTLGCSEDLYYKINSGKKTPTAAFRRAAANLLRVPESRLFVPIPAYQEARK